ncbi:MAG: hypothetical protein Q9185_004117 [Variospora sp. 1 TL-2023]
MASHEHVIVPAHTPKPLPSHLRSELTSALLSNSAIPVIQSTLHEASQEVYWERSIQERAKQIIVQGHATGWQEVVDMLVEESCERPHNSPHNSPRNRPQVSGRLRRLRQDQSNFTGPAHSPTEAINVTFPEQARKAGKKAIREALDPLIEVETREGVEDTKLPLRERDISPFTSPTNKLKFVVSTSTSCRSDDQTFRSQISSVCNQYLVRVKKFFRRVDRCSWSGFQTYRYRFVVCVISFDLTHVQFEGTEDDDLGPWIIEIIELQHRQWARR